MYINSLNQLNVPNIFFIGSNLFDSSVTRPILLFSGLSSKANLYVIQRPNELLVYETQMPDVIYIADYIDIKALDYIEENYQNIPIIYERSRKFDDIDELLKQFDDKAIKLATHIICRHKDLAIKNATVIDDGVSLFYLDDVTYNNTKDGVVYMSSIYNDYLDFDFINQKILDNPDIPFYFYVDTILSFSIKKRDNVFFLAPVEGPYNKIIELSKYKYSWIPTKPSFLYYEYPLEVYNSIQAHTPIYVSNLPIFSENMTDNFETLLKMSFKKDHLQSVDNYIDNVYNFITDILKERGIMYNRNYPLSPNLPFTVSDTQLLS